MPVGTNGLIVWVFATPYDSGTVPVVTGLVEAPAAATQEYALQVQGPPTNTSVTLKAFAPPAATVSLLGVAASVSWPVAPAGTYIHVQAAKPTQ